jgi:hypothetical protein
MRPSPHRCPTWHGPPGGRQARVVLKVGDHLYPLLKLSVMRLHMVLKVDNPVGAGLHLLTGDVEQHTGVVPSMLGVTKVMVNPLSLPVLL